MFDKKKKKRQLLHTIFSLCWHWFLAGYIFKASTVHASSNPKLSSNRNQLGNTQQDKLDTAKTYFTDMQKWTQVTQFNINFCEQTLGHQSDSQKLKGYQ